MSSRGYGGKERSRRDYAALERGNPPERRGNNPPSRHLWVGNISHSLSERDVTDHFLQFGDLEKVAFQAGRSYAFINFKNDDDAFAAMEALQGFPIAGNPLKIEFAKADKLTAQSHTEVQSHWDEQRSTARRVSPFVQRDSSRHHGSPDSNAMKSSMDDAEPSEVLWIGFPALLRVDELILRKAFSPFGEIERITVFQGRSYAFVQFRNVMSAYRAKETLQGKLFGNPRVHICFAKSDSGRRPTSDSLSPHIKFNGRLGSADNYPSDRNYGSTIGDLRPSRFTNLDSNDQDVYNFNNRKRSLRSDGENAYDDYSRFEEERPQDMYELRDSPRDRGAAFHDYPPRYPQKRSLYEEPWDLPEDGYSYQGAKKMKRGSFVLDQDLPEYPLSDLEQESHAFQRVASDFPPADAFERNFDARKQLSGSRPGTLALSYEERSNEFRTSYDKSLAASYLERQRYTPDRPSLKDWKWEGTIAKGGNPVCRARCFPVGKSMDMMLPEFIDCTARTGLEMLAKHYYQASNAWVVFFVPESDADMALYNEFMHYLEEKQRAAVSKLDDKTTLFLVPPSEFSEKVLKVPGKLSISGVVLRLQDSSSGFHQPSERKDPNSSDYHGETFYPKPSPSSQHYPSVPYVPVEKSFDGNNIPMSEPSASFPGSSRDPYLKNRHEQRLSPHDQQYEVLSSNRIARSHASSNSNAHLSAPGPHLRTSETSLSQYYPETEPSVPQSISIGGLQPELLAQLASSLLRQQNQAGSSQNVFTGENLNQPENLPRPQDRYVPQNNQVGLESSASPFGQPDSRGTQEEQDADPQQRLQATLQLAAVLLQQIQQGKGN